MSKRKSSGRAVLKQFTAEPFLLRVLRDLSAYTDLGRVINSLVTDPSTVRAVVSQELSEAERHRDDGGFVRYAIMRQVDALFKKNTSFQPVANSLSELAAKKKFEAAERKCARTNARLEHFRKHWSRAPLAAQILNAAKDIIYDVLGDMESEVYREVFAFCRPTSGASFSERAHQDLSLAAKLERPWTATQDVLPIVKDYLNSSPALWQFFVSAGKGVDVVRGDRVSFVPKNWDVHRSIAVQPAWNVFLQKGVDTVMRRKMKRVGINLADQTLNHIPARIGSVDGSYATIDLSSASDTVSRVLVEQLFPENWVWLLNLLRTKEYILDGEWCKYHKFTAMGNCTTFPVETLIFWSISKACLAYCNCDLGMLQVYGDDIVVQRHVYPLVIEVLRYAGFEPNTAKCFALGSFRETCGCDFVSGIDVRPVYVKHFPKSVQDVYNLYNRLLLNRLGLAFPSTLEYLLSLVRRAHFGPCFSLRKDEYQKWYAGKSVSYDYYFISEPPEQRNWDLELMTYSYTFVSLQTKYLKPKVPHRGTAVYRAGLLTSSFSVVTTNRSRVFQRTEKVFYWPTLREALTRITENRALDIC